MTSKKKVLMLIKKKSAVTVKKKRKKFLSGIILIVDDNCSLTNWLTIIMGYCKDCCLEKWRQNNRKQVSDTNTSDVFVSIVFVRVVYLFFNTPLQTGNRIVVICRSLTL